MRRILCVILLGGLLLTMLSGCTSREPSPESGSESRTASASEPLSPEDPFYEEMLRTLGAEKTEDGLLVATPCSLLTVNWAEPEDLEGYRYCHWYMEQLSDLPAEEKRARYTPPEGETGWLIPAEELEQAAGERFGVSAEHLRADTDCYREDLGGYQTGGVGLGDRPVLTVTAVRADGDREILTVQEEWTVEQRSGTIELTIRPERGGLAGYELHAGAPGRSCPDCPGPAGPAGLWCPGGGRRPALLWDQPVLSRWLGQFQRAHRRAGLGADLLGRTPPAERRYLDGAALRSQCRGHPGAGQPHCPAPGR